MAKEAVFTMKLEPELRSAFMEAAASDDRPASQVVRELMRDYIEKKHQARDYDAFLRQKIAAAQKSMQMGQGRSNEDVEADFAARRTASARA